MRILEVERARPQTARVVEREDSVLAEGRARLRVELVALTANNVTYAALGSGALGYWDFFPASEGWGTPPAWGFATVVESRAPGVEVGTRFFGYLPVASALDVTPTAVSPRGFVDGAAHRAGKAAVYNHYVATASDPLYDPDFEAEQALFLPLFATGWWLADRLRRAAPASIVLSSASSKTALATAHALRERAGAELVGITSERNRAYVESTGLYDRTLTYDAVASLSAPAPAAFVDFLGRSALLHAVHRALGERLRESHLVGMTEWSTDDLTFGSKRSPPGPKPELFFVPTYLASRLREAPELGAAMQRDLRAFYPRSRELVAASRREGPDAVLASWRALVHGALSPREGLVVSLAAGG